MDQKETVINQMPVWISKTVRMGGGRVFDFKQILTKCAEDLNVDCVDFLAEALSVALVRSGFIVKNDTQGEKFVYNLELIDAPKKMKRAQKKA